MKMLRHDDVSVDHEAIPLARFFQDAQKKVAALGRAQLRLAMVATTGNEMQIMAAVVAMQAPGHLVRVDKGF
jgi:hypothetical protein